MHWLLGLIVRFWQRLWLLGRRTRVYRWAKPRDTKPATQTGFLLTECFYDDDQRR